ncbi:MAG: hypothetical protein A2Y12_02895 [Planctomycetes bacterium GWF2_42_9]|nr:MAG: hypothetical protein A2Y12_02895 [Planctomycetes bacterium GWF2_42_9]
MLEKINKDIICFGGEDWWYHNRGHIDFQLMKRFAKQSKVLYVNSLVMQKPKIANSGDFLKKLIRKSKSMLNGLQKTEEGFYVFSPVSFPLHHIASASSINDFIVGLQSALVCEKLHINRPNVWVACPTAANIAINIRKNFLIYQRTDKFEEFPNVDQKLIKKLDLLLKKNADFTLFVNESLYNIEADKCKKAVLIDHGVDFESFASAENDKDIPGDIKNIKKPIAGFFGGIDSHTFDMEFMEKVIDICKEISFVFVGKSSVECRQLLSKPNVRMLGQKPYEQIPHYGKYFDAAIMPWKNNSWIEHCNPIKLKEYLALGKPVVSTPFSELKKYTDVVYSSEKPNEFAALLNKAINEHNEEQKKARRDKVRIYTWDNQAKIISEMIWGNSELVKQPEELTGGINEYEKI